MLNVIIDSNIVIASYYLKYAAFSKFCRYFPERSIRVYITEVSIEEIFKNYRNNYKEIIFDFNRVKKKLKGVEIELKNIDSEEDANARYQDYLYGFFNDNNITILPYPKIGHKEIVKYSVTGKKPFKQKDTGYKDFLIWHSALSLLQESEQPVIILTKDSDFLEESKICKDFLDFLISNDVDSSRLDILTSVNEFNQKYLDEVIEKADLRKYLEENKNAEEFIEKFKDDFEDKLEGYDLDNNNFLGQDFENPTISYASYIDFDPINDMEFYDDENFIITITMRLNSDIDFYIFKSDYYVMAEENHSFEILDMNWNKHYVAAYENMDLEVEFSIIVDKKMTNIIQIDVNNIRKCVDNR